jgi:hypothetical protein
MCENKFVSFKFHYSLSNKIPFTELSDNIPNVEFVKEDNYLTGFNVVLRKPLELEEAEKESEEFAYLVCDLISIKSNRHVIPILNGYLATDITGKGRTSKSVTYSYNVEGAPSKLDIYHLLSRVLKSNNPQIKQYLGYLAKGITLQFEHFPDHSIIEAFKIIEEIKDFPLYEKYYALRNILVHSPEYREKTASSFRKFFDENSFDYVMYNRDSNIIILNLHSNKTQKILNQVANELMIEIKKYLKIL